MKKAEFLAQLRQRLYQLPQRDIEQTLEYYSEMIDDYIESGYTPDEAVAAMGDVDTVAAQILAGARRSTDRANGRQGNRDNNTLLWVLVLIFAFPVWFPLLITAFSLLLTLAILIGVFAVVLPWSLVIAFGASALGLLFATPAIFAGEGIAAAVLAGGTALVLVALCIFCLWVGLHLTGLAVKGITAIFKGFSNLISRRRNNR